MTVLMVGAIIAAVLGFALYMLPTKHALNPRKRHATTLDIEQSAALMDTSGRLDDSDSSREPCLLYSSPHINSFIEKDQEAANSQLLDEFAASTASNTLQNSEAGEPVEKLPDPDATVHVSLNPKQYHRILKRRVFRQEFAEALRKARIAKVQGRSSRRSKVPGGMMMALS